MTTTTTMAELPALTGRELGTSDWIEVTQDRVNTFAEATDDHQWIHVDVDRARAESPFGGPIAHGYLTLALLIPLWTQVLTVTDATMAVNYGLNKVRFPGAGPRRQQGAAHRHADRRRGDSRRPSAHRRRRDRAGRRREAGVHRRTRVPLPRLTGARRTSGGAVHRDLSSG
jgi:MaoC like domain